MDCTVTHLSFQQTGYFSKIITDYLDGADALRPFYEYPISEDGLKASIHSRKQFHTDRAVLVEVLREQYAQIETSDSVRNNIDKLLAENTFTFTTAHQPVIFTGTLYFIYKILHVIKLAAHFSKEWPQYQFVPVFYMGSEDADLDELGKLYLDHEKIVWDTNQTGAVGRMHTKGLEKIISRIEGELSVEPFGKELITLLKEAYLDSPDVQTATFKLINRLFAEYGLVVLIPDHEKLKREMISIFEDDLFNERPSGLVGETIKELSAFYKVQANPRAINLFYLKNDLRGRIERVKDNFIVHESNLSFTKDSLKTELVTHPERFSPNVILRGLLQETILPNIAFVGGGGETAYWLELKALFHHYQVPYPLLILRNSYLVIEKKWEEKIHKTGLPVSHFFRKEEELINDLVKRESVNQLKLDGEIKEMRVLYEKLKLIAGATDPTLKMHVDSMMTRALKSIVELEKKMLKAEKRKFSDRSKQIHAVKTALFPFSSLQERIDNFMPYYAKHGKSFIDILYQNAQALNSDFIVLSGL